MQLSNKDLTAIKALSRSNVKSTLSGLKPFIEASLWVGRKNRYTTDTINKINAELKIGAIVRPRQLSQYIAASVVLHCSDGWSYLGRALFALLRGDPHRARHLAYYAELRAAMSLLASVGIGVFNDRHFVIDKPSSVSLLSGKYRTHVFVWDCIECWGDLNSSGDLFSRVIRPHGIELSDWLQPIGGAGAVAAQAKAWFLQWGMDLQVPHFDQRVRNESSYRPDGLHKNWAIDAAEVLLFAREFWSSMEPTSASRFENVDRHILRVALETAFKGTTGQTAAKNKAAFKANVTRVVEALSLDASTARRWVEFLGRET